MTGNWQNGTLSRTWISVVEATDVVLAKIGASSNADFKPTRSTLCLLQYERYLLPPGLMFLCKISLLTPTEPERDFCTKKWNNLNGLG